MSGGYTIYCILELLVRILFGDIKEKLAFEKIHFTPSGSARFKDYEFISFSDSFEIEPYTAFLGGSNLFSMGSFSYSWSALPISASVGRYCL